MVRSRISFVSFALLFAVLSLPANAKERPAPGTTPLMWAAQYGQLEKISRLLDQGADIEAENPNGVTALGTAVIGRQTESAKLLLSRGATLRPNDIYTARSVGAEDLVHLLGKHITDPASLSLADIGVLTSAGIKIPPAKDSAAGAAPVVAAPVAVAAASPKSDVDEPKEKGEERPDDFALVIGIEDYQSLPKADFGARDAEAVRKHLEALGIPARNIITLKGPAATGSKIKSYLEEWLPLNVKETSTLFVYYSGHGAPDPKTGQAYLVPWDGDPQFLKSTAYPLKKFYSELGKTKAKHIVVALDACFSGAGGRSVLAKGARPLVTKVDAGLSPDSRLTVLAAASGDQITGTLDEQGHGMFTYFFLKGLNEGNVSAKALFDYLDPKVRDEARRQNREQTPALLGADSPL